MNLQNPYSFLRGK